MFGLPSGPEVLRKSETLLFAFHSTAFLASLTLYREICAKRQNLHVTDPSAEDL